MKQIILTAFLSAALLSQMRVVAQQLDPGIAQNYPPSIVAKVYDVVSKSNITAVKQKTIAAFFKMQDSTLNAMILANKSNKSIDSVSKIMNRNFDNLLSAEEKYDYYNDAKDNKKKRAKSFRLLSLAIDNKNDLQLTANQKRRLVVLLDSLKQAEDDFYATNPDKYFSAKGKENASLHNVLSNAQYMQLLAMDNKPKVAGKAEDMSFYSQFSLAIKYKDSLQLTTVQIDSIAVCLDILKSKANLYTTQNPGKFYDSRAYQSETLNRILSTTQYTKLLALKNKSKAQNFALNDWKELEQRSLTAGYNKDMVLQQLTAFYISRESAFNRYAHDRVALSSNIKAVYAGKPQSLIALEHARRNPANNTINQGYNWQP